MFLDKKGHNYCEEVVPEEEAGGYVSGMCNCGRKIEQRYQ